MTITVTAVLEVLNLLSKNQGREVRGERRKFGDKGVLRSTTCWPWWPAKIAQPVLNVHSKRLMQSEEGFVKWVEPPLD